MDQHLRMQPRSDLAPLTVDASGAKKPRNNYNRIWCAGWPLSRQCEMPWRFEALSMLSVTHIMPILL